MRRVGRGTARDSVHLRTIGATQAEKSTVKSSHMNAVASGAAADAPHALAAADVVDDIRYCAIDNPDCEACQ